jgi:hypothetical protein
VKVYSLEGARNWLDLLAGTALTQVAWRLFKNNVSPQQSSVLADFVEADFSGYAVVPPPVVGWSVSVTSGGVAKTAANLISWSRGIGPTSNTIYGYFLTDGPGTYLYAAELFAVPIPMNAPPDLIQLVPVETFVSQFLGP